MKKLYPIRKRAFRNAFFVLLFMAFASAVTAQNQVPTGAINGVFTINENGDRVYFSQGNLQYQASTDTWRFAEHQCDYTGYDNENVSQSYDGWIDLFGWGTSGYNHGATCYQPWSTSTNSSDYYAYGSYANNLYNQTGQADWGYNAISNGGNQENSGWRTLTQAEWDYVFNTRSTVSGIRYAWAQVNGVNGVMLFPDNWNSSYYMPNSSGNYESNQPSVNQWIDLEQRGVVFLPAAGYRYGTSVNDVGSYGNYWSASYDDSYDAYRVYLYGSNLGTSYYSRYYGLAVRLVRPAQNSILGIEATPVPAVGGVVSGGGAYQQGADCTLTATPSAGYEFAGWVENDVVVSSNPSYTFTVTADRWLLAMFRSNDFHVENGTLNGSFSVSGTNKVNFSQGNLQYIGSAATPYWKFAEHQTNYLGYNTNQGSENQKVDRDLFGWGTNGFDHGAVCYQPWSTSTEYSDYYVWGDYNYNLYDYDGLADWGHNAISNGGNQEDYGWRTMTNNEWSYIFSRNTASGVCFAKANVNGVNGVMLFPDLWNSSYYLPNYVNQTSAGYNTNTLDADQWSILEQHGVVFLPAAGGRYGTSVEDVGSYGDYWSASYSDGYSAYYVFFYGSDLSTFYYGDRYCGLSVRLVRPSQNGILGVKATPVPAVGGVVSGAGAYAEGAECTLTATPSDGYVFFGWVENGVVVSTDLSCSFTVTGDRWLVAQFKKPSSIVFSDAIVEAICLENWDDDHDGFLSFEEAAAVTSIDLVFKNNTEITSFDELRYFTGLESITAQAFSGCTNLASVTLPESLTSIGQQAFLNCKALSELTIPNSVTSVGNQAFMNCTGLASVTIGSAVSQIGTFAFAGCSNIQAIHALAVTPPSVTANAFSMETSGVALYVPCDAIATYQAHSVWGSFDIQNSPYELAVLSEDDTQGTVNIEKHATCDDMVCIVKANPNLHYGFSCWLKDGEVVSTERVYTFELEENTTLVARFVDNESITPHWVANHNAYSGNMSVTYVVQIDGVEQASSALELGAFCGDECRGSVIAEYFQPADRYIYYLTLFGNDGDVINFRLFDHNNQQELTLFCETELTYVTEGDYMYPDNPWVISFFSKVNINATVTPAGSGEVTGTGEYYPGETAALTATANEGYAFNCWKENGTVVSTETEYSFTVMGARYLVACFDHVQQTALNEGWNWWSSYIELSDIDGLAQLENSLGSSGVQIKSRNDGFVQYSNSMWFGELEDVGIVNEQFYMVKTSSECQASVVGQWAQPYNHPITLASGWNWIGYPSHQSISLGTALSGFTPEDHDMIKSRFNASTYYVNEADGTGSWQGTLKTVEPGMGYMYDSKSSGTKILTFVQGRGETAEANLSMENNFFKPSVGNFADNMVVMAVLDMNGEELRGEHYELAAFAGDECRGSVKLLYVDVIDRYVAFLMAFGEQDDLLTFRFTDGTTTVTAAERAIFAANDNKGSLKDPLVLHFRGSGVSDEVTPEVSVYPNPSNGAFLVEGQGLRLVEVFNAFGQRVFACEANENIQKVDLSHCAVGVYQIRVVTSDGVVNHTVVKQ
jgi:hypothetical protein